MEKELSAYKQSLGYQTESFSIEQTPNPIYKRFAVEFNRNFQSVTGISFFTSADVNVLIDVRVSMEDDYEQVISPVSIKYMNANPAMLPKNLLFRDIFRRGLGAKAYIVIQAQKVDIDFRLDVTFRLQNGVKHPGWEIDYQQVPIALKTESVQPLNNLLSHPITLPKIGKYVFPFTFDTNYRECIGYSSVFANRFLMNDLFVELKYQNNVLCNRVLGRFSLSSSVIPYSQTMFPLNFTSQGKTIEIELDIQRSSPVINLPVFNEQYWISKMQEMAEQLDEDGIDPRILIMAQQGIDILPILENNSFAMLGSMAPLLQMIHLENKELTEVVNNTYYIIFLLKRYVKPSR